MNIKKIVIAALALCAASVACAASSDEIYLSAGTKAPAERPFAKKKSAPKGHVRADGSSRTENELPVIESSIPLILAARDGDAEKVRELLADGEVDAHEKNGITALMVAALYSREQIADELLERGADVNASSEVGWTPIMFALHGRLSVDFIEKLLERGAFPESRAKDGTSAMMIACANAADPQIVRLLYARGADIAIPNKVGDMPLHFVARNSSDAAAEITEFLVKSRSPLWERNEADLTPLMAAAQNSPRVGVVEALLAADWQVDAKKEDGTTALMLAAGNPTPDALKIARRLAGAGARFDTVDDMGRSPYLVGLCSAHSLEMVQWLKTAERDAAEREMNARVSVQPTAKIVAGAGQIVLSPKRKSEGTEEADAENSEAAIDKKIETAEGPEVNQEATEKDSQVKTLAFASKAQNSPGKSCGEGEENSEAVPLANVNLASRHIATSSLSAVQAKKSDMRPFKKRRALKKAQIARKTDPVLVPPLLLAAVNPTDAAPEIIAWLLEKGESLEARDTEGRNALICAVRYNSNPSAARALLGAGANARVAFKKSSLLQLLRYNEVMENDDKVELAKFIRAAKKR